MKDYIRQQLVKELERAQAPVTGRKVACVIETDKERFHAHNIEYKDGVFDHAEANAARLLKQSGKFSSIKRISIAGIGQKKIKNIIPCPQCIVKLSPFLQKKSQIILYTPGTVRKKIRIPYSRLTLIESPQEYSQIEGNTVKEIVESLRNKTVLKGKELKFIAELRLFGIHENVHIYLTGSKSGRGTAAYINTQIKNEHNDIDLIIITKQNKSIIKKKFSKLTSKFYRIKKIDKKKFNTYSGKRKIKRNEFIVYYGIKNKKIIDLAIAKNPKEGFSQYFYYERNWYHQLS